MKHPWKTTLGFTVVVIAVVIFLYYAQFGIFESLEARTYDLRFRALGMDKQPSGKIAVVEVDEKSLAEIGRFPWSRLEYINLLDVCTKGGAKAVLFDIFFPEPESTAVDEAFAAAIRRHGNVVLPVAFVFSPDGEPTGMVENIPTIQGNARFVAHINVSPDQDGVLRWSRLVVKREGREYPSLGLAAAMSALGADGFEAGDFEVRLGESTIPTDGEHRFLVNYTGAEKASGRISFADLAMGRVAPEAIRDRTLIVGPTALGIYDMRITPYSNNFSGVETNANIADSLVTGNFRTKGGKEALSDLLFIVLLSLATSLVAIRLKAKAALPFVLLLLGSYVFYASFMFTRGSWLNVIYPLSGAVLCYSFASYSRFVTLDRREKEIRSMFSSYISKKIVDELVKNPEMAKVGGESRVVTILFADLQNYTGYSEKRTPREVVSILNEYLSAMTDVVMRFDGTVNKFMGDGILAFWGAPVLQEDHALLAANCAIAMADGMRQLRTKWESEGLEPVSCGIGINTGEVIVGNIGVAGKRVEYTVIGDSVNLTHRIQNESRRAGCPVITGSVYELVKGRIGAEHMGHVMVKGRQKPVEIFALRGLMETDRKGVIR